MEEDLAHWKCMEMIGNVWGPEIYLSPSGVGSNPSNVSSDSSRFKVKGPDLPERVWACLMEDWWIEKKWEIKKHQSLWIFIFF